MARSTPPPGPRSPRPGRVRARPLRHAPRERGTMLIMCLAIIVAILMLATAFLASVMSRRDQTAGTRIHAYGQAAALLAEAAAQYTLNEAPLYTDPITYEHGLDGRVSTDTDDTGDLALDDDNGAAFRQHGVFGFYFETDGTSAISAVGTASSTSNAYDLWTRLTGPAPAKIPFNTVFDRQHPAQPLGWAIDGGGSFYTKALGTTAGMYDKAFKPVTSSSDAFYTSRGHVLAVDLSGLIPFGVPVGINPAAVAPGVPFTRNTHAKRIADLLAEWGAFKFGSEANGPFGTLTLSDAELDAIVAAASADYTAGRGPAQSVDDIFGQLVTDQASAAGKITLAKFNTLRQNGIWAQWAPPAYVIPYTGFSEAPESPNPDNRSDFQKRWTQNRARFHQLVDTPDDDPDIVRELQKPLNEAVPNHNPIFLLNANTASLRTLATLHRFTQTELAEIATPYINGTSKDATGKIGDTIANPLYFAVRAALGELLSGAYGFEADNGGTNDATRHEEATKAVINPIESQRAKVQNDALGFDLSRAWAIRLYTGQDPDDLDKLGPHRRLVLHHDPDGDRRADGGVTLQGKIGTDKRAALVADITRVREPIAPASSTANGWSDLMAGYNVAHSLPTLGFEVTQKVIRKVEAGAEAGDPDIITYIKDATAKTKVRLYWEEDDDVDGDSNPIKVPRSYIPPLPVGEMLWGLRHPYRPRPSTDADGLPYNNTFDDPGTNLFDRKNFYHAIQAEFHHILHDESGKPVDKDGKVVAEGENWVAITTLADWKGGATSHVSTCITAIHTAFIDLEQGLYRTIGAKYAPIARLFCNQTGGPWRVLARGEFYDLAQSAVIARTDVEFVHVPGYHLEPFIEEGVGGDPLINDSTEYPLTGDGSDVAHRYLNYLPAYASTGYRRVLE